MCKPEYFENKKREEAIRHMVAAVTAHPYMVYGTGGFCTVLMEKCDGAVLGKRGAAGVYVCGLVDRGLGCAVKMDDGTMGPQYNVVMKFLKWAKHNSGGDNHAADQDGTGGDKVVNALHCSELQKFSITPSLNSMDIDVGKLVCNDEVFKV